MQTPIKSHLEIPDRSNRTHSYLQIGQSTGSDTCSARSTPERHRSEGHYTRIHFCREISPPCAGARVCTCSSNDTSVSLQACFVCLFRLRLTVMLGTSLSLLVVYGPSILAFRHCRETLHGSEDATSRRRKSQYRAFNKPAERRYGAFNLQCCKN